LAFSTVSKDRRHPPVSVAVFFAVLFFVGAVLVLSAHSSAGPPPDFSAEERVRMEKGEPVLREEQFTDAEGNRVGRGVSYGIINAGPEKIWNVILDFDNYTEFYPNVHTAKLTKKKNNHFFVYFVLNVLSVVKVRYNVDHTLHPAENRLTWRMDRTKKNDFRETTGFWQIWPLPGEKSLVCYSVYVETGRGIPKFVQKLVDKIGLTSWGLKKVVACLKKRVELGSGYKGEPDRILKGSEIPEGGNGSL